jgi:hypothetical protein
VHMKRSEARRETSLRLGTDRLLAEEKSLVLDQQLAETVDHGLGKVLREVDPTYDGAERTRHARYLNGHF